MPSKPAAPFGAHLGRRLREIREDRGWRQDDVAAAAREVGMDWSRATVAAVESGRRQLGAEELLLLPVALSIAAPVATDAWSEITLADLLPTDEWVEMTPETRLRRSVLERIARSESLATLAYREHDTPLSRSVSKAAAGLARAFDSGEITAALDEHRSILKQVWPDGLAKSAAWFAGDFRRDHESEAVAKAARRLRVAPFAVTAAAYCLWGRGFAAERDARLSVDAAPDASPRTVQAHRGHISRALLAEVEPVVAALKPRSRGRK